MKTARVVLYKEHYPGHMAAQIIAEAEIKSNSLEYGEEEERMLFFALQYRHNYLPDGCPQEVCVYSDRIQPDTFFLSSKQLRRI